MIQAVICHDPATISINQPVSDSVVVSPVVTVSGTVAQATQIEVKVDTQFNSIVPLDAAATDFMTTLQLAPGTHTITLTAIDVCQIGNASGSVVITYQAPSQATSGSVGSDTPTSIPSAGGVVIGAGGAMGQVAGGAPTAIDHLLAPLVALGRNLDIVPQGQAARAASHTPALVRILLLIFGFGVIVFSQQLTRLFGGSTSLLGTHSTRIRRSLFVMIGSGLIALAFLLA